MMLLVEFEGSGEPLNYSAPVFVAAGCVWYQGSPVPRDLFCEPVGVPSTRPFLAKFLTLSLERQHHDSR